ncbi:MAG: hypothetical protein R3C17_10845 [Planctomycetaceae bacterium]
MSRDKVIEGALKRLPKNARVDLVGYPAGQWVKVIKDNLTVSSAFSTTVTDLSYRSRDPKAAATVLRAMLAAYEEYLDATHNGSSEESIKKLESQLSEDRIRLDQAIAQRLALRKMAPELVETGDKNSGLSIVSDTIRLLNADRAAAHQLTEQSRTQFDGLQRAILNGEDILQFASDIGGKQLIDQSMGFGTQDAYLLQRINQELLDMESTLRDELTRYGEKHSRIVATRKVFRLRNSIWRTIPPGSRKNCSKCHEPGYSALICFSTCGSSLKRICRMSRRLRCCSKARRRKLSIWIRLFQTLPKRIAKLNAWVNGSRCIRTRWTGLVSTKTRW